MEFVVGIAIVAGVIWLLLRENTRRGVKTVRAFLYMKALEEGAGVDEANRAARIEGGAPRKGDIADTMAHLQAHYRGRQLLLIKAAEKAGWEE